MVTVFSSWGTDGVGALPPGHATTIPQFGLVVRIAARPSITRCAPLAVFRRSQSMALQTQHGRRTVSPLGRASHPGAPPLVQEVPALVRQRVCRPVQHKPNDTAEDRDADPTHGREAIRLRGHVWCGLDGWCGVMQAVLNPATWHGIALIGQPHAEPASQYGFSCSIVK